MSEYILDKLYKILQARKVATRGESYVASLYAKGTPKISEKILEEAKEFIDEAYALDRNIDDKNIQNNIRNEAADLLFHVMVMLSHHDIPPSDILDILEQRFGVSGHDEKANRKT